MKATVKESVNLRAAPSTTGKLLDQLGPGVKLEVLMGESPLYPGWSKVKVVKTNKNNDGVGVKGYVATRYIAIEQPPPPDVPPPEDAETSPLFSWGQAVGYAISLLFVAIVALLVVRARGG